MFKLKEYGMLLTINKIHTFHSNVKYMALLLSSKDNLPTISPLGSHVKAISTLPIPITARGIKLFMGCVIYLAQFLPKLSELIKPINDILKNAIKSIKLIKLVPCRHMPKAEVQVKRDLLTFRSSGCQYILLTLRQLISVKAPILHLPARTARFYLECDSSAKHVGSVLYQMQNDHKQATGTKNLSSM